MGHLFGMQVSLRPSEKRKRMMKHRFITAFAVALTGCGTVCCFAQKSSQVRIKPRLIVLTDISSLEAGIREPDDAQSMIRLLLYTNEIDVEGLIASSNLRHGQTVRPELIEKIVDAYAKVRPNLLLHDAGYPAAEHLKSLIKRGQAVADEEIPVFNSIGEGKDTEGSEWIIRMADRSDRRPLWVAVWGGSADLAQALWKVRSTRTPEETAAFVSRIRVHAIGDQDMTGPWIKSEFPDLYYITRGKGIRGIYRAGDTTLVRSGWVRHNIRQGHGALGAIYPDYSGGDIWVGALGRVTGIKEGDTPSFLGLMDNGLSRPGEPGLVNWGGPVRRDSLYRNRYVDAIDPVPGYDQDISPYLAGVYRWRPAFQADFLARLNWCVKPYAAANHAPACSERAWVEEDVKSGQEITLEATGWTDPDGDQLRYHWQFLPQEGTCTETLQLTEAASGKAAFRVPEVEEACVVHVLLTVSDDAEPSLNRYQRRIFRILPGE